MRDNWIGKRMIEGSKRVLEGQEGLGGHKWRNKKGEFWCLEGREGYSGKAEGFGDNYGKKGEFGGEQQRRGFREKENSVPCAGVTRGVTSRGVTSRGVTSQGVTVGVTVQ